MARVYLETSLNLIGAYRSHLDVFSQGGLHMLIYRKEDFTGFVDQLLLMNLAETKFDPQLHEFFAT